MRDIQKTKELLKKADLFIANHPEVLNMSTDDIFHKLDDGTEEMKCLRWGIMTRVSMLKLNGDICDIVDSLSDISEGSLLCEYIGTVLQQEKGIDLLDLLLKANEKGVVNEIIPFITEALPLGEDCHIKDIDEVNKCIECIEDSTNRIRLIHSYAELIVNKEEEDSVFDRFIVTADRSIGQLVLEMRTSLKHKKNEKYKKWEKTLVEDTREQVSIIGIQYIRSSDTSNEDINQYYHVLKQYRKNDEFMVALIPIYIEYLNEKTGTIIKEIINDIIQCIQERRMKVVDSLINSLYLVEGPCENIEKILEVLFHIELNGFMDLLSKGDYSLASIYSSRPNLLFELIHKAFVSNHIGWAQVKWKKLPNISVLLRNNSQLIIDDWLGFIEGTDYDYLFAISCIGTIIDVGIIHEIIIGCKWSEIRVLQFLEGCCLFMTYDSQCIELLFLFADCMTDQMKYFDFCYDNAYLNYPGKTISMAERYLSDENEKKKKLSEWLIDKNNEKKKRLMAGSAIKDFKPSIYRLHIYNGFKQDDNRTINKKAMEESIFSAIFNPRKMKYGKRIAFVQRDRDNYYYRVSPVITSSYSIEVPTRELLYPVKMIQKRSLFLERRGNRTDEVDP